MGRMKTIFTDIQLALENDDFVSVMETLNNTTDKEEYKKELLFGTIETLASWQREDQERQNQQEWLQVKTGILQAIKNMEAN